MNDRLAGHRHYDAFEHWTQQHPCWPSPQSWPGTLFASTRSGVWLLVLARPSSRCSCFWAATGRLDLEGVMACWGVPMCGREDAWPRAPYGKESAISCRVSFWRAKMVPCPFGGVFQMSSSNGGLAGSVCVYPGLMTWGSACCPANGRACVQMGCAVGRADRFHSTVLV